MQRSLGPRKSYLSFPNPENLVPFPQRVWGFIWRVLKNFRRNKGLLLAGAVGYNALLSMIPALAIAIYVLSAFMDTEALLMVISAEVDLAIPGRTEAISSALESFSETRHLVGAVGLAVLLFFASIAFRMVEDAMSVIFRHHKRVKTRHPVISALMPFIYVSVVTFAVFVVTVVVTAYEAVASRGVWLFDRELQLEGYLPLLLKFLGFVGVVSLFTSFYRVLPMARVRLRLAIFGGLIAGILWEFVRAFLVWYFASISLVNAVYGSVATVVIVLLSMEIAAVILLLGAQVIAEIEVSAEAGLPWWEEPKRSVRVFHDPPTEDLETK